MIFFPQQGCYCNLLIGNPIFQQWRYGRSDATILICNVFNAINHISKAEKNCPVIAEAANKAGKFEVRNDGGQPEGVRFRHFLE